MTAVITIKQKPSIIIMIHYSDIIFIMSQFNCDVLERESPLLFVAEQLFSFHSSANHMHNNF